ncbi:hypothetical protein BVC80_1551g37 [Macleaya cordata]|uniref:Uncharacterized protein n=1 Tax=Macleaya cordata TaxID=56857 RepID=A0A200QYD0_MACCD|nr:hypothetical protein BVC80_1551g37 [Macleaya cordata]
MMLIVPIFFIYQVSGIRLAKFDVPSTTGVAPAGSHHVQPLELETSLPRGPITPSGPSTCTNIGSSGRRTRSKKCPIKIKNIDGSLSAAMHPKSSPPPPPASTASPRTINP